MLCHICNKEKLSKEFVYENLSEECVHPALFCMECALEKRNSGKCPYKKCNVPVPPASDAFEEYQSVTDSLYPKLEHNEDIEATDSPQMSLHGSIVSVVLLTGERLLISVSLTSTVMDLKQEIFQRNSTPVENQKLIFNEKELKVMNDDGSMATLKVYGIKNNSTICLLIMMYSIPEHFNNVTFDLYWHYPVFRKDYLDATCLIFSGITFLQAIDYRKSHVGEFTMVKHSGDLMDDLNSIGHHTIGVSLKDMPSPVTHLFFILSAWNSPTIQHFPNPSLKFYETSNKTKDLCSTAFTHALHSQAVIMCSLSRKSGVWQIFRSGKLSSGNAKNYVPIIQTIQTLIQSGV